MEFNADTVVAYLESHYDLKFERDKESKRKPDMKKLHYFKEKAW